MALDFAVFGPAIKRVAAEKGTTQEWVIRCYVSGNPFAVETISRYMQEAKDATL